MAGDERETVQIIDCSNEDSNQNGVLETGEDINTNGRVEPTPANTTVPAQAVLTTL